MSETIGQQLAALVDSKALKVEAATPTAQDRKSYRSPLSLDECVDLLNVTVSNDCIYLNAKDPVAFQAAFRSTEFFYVCMRSMLRQQHKQGAWTIRYGAEIHPQNVPFILDHINHVAVFDPLAPYRDIVVSLKNAETVSLSIIQARPFYAKNRSLLKNVPEKAVAPHEHHRKPRKNRTEGENLAGTEKGSGSESTQGIRPSESQPSQD